MDDPIVHDKSPDLRVLSLKYINLECCLVGSKPIARFVAACSRLETLSISWDDPERAYDSQTSDIVSAQYLSFGWSHLAKALATHRESLAHLSLSTVELKREFVQGEQNSTKDSGFWQCLGKMTHLKSLSCCVPLAHGSTTATGEAMTSVMPKSVRDLRLVEDLNSHGRVDPDEEARAMRLDSLKHLLADESFT